MTRTEMPSALGTYVLDEHIASGTTATIWRGHDPRTGRAVAVKRFHQHLLADRSARRRMENEAKAARSVRGRTVVSAIDRISNRDEFALVFPYITGSTLAERLRASTPMAPHEAAAICADVADALVAIHKRSLVHRDVKPANVLLREDGTAVLLDFGISQAVSDDIALDQALTGAGLAIGTLPYMAPEQLTAQQLTPQTDIYALGAVLYEMLAGSRPYQATSPVTLAAEQRMPAPRIADAPAPLVDLALRSLAFSPTARPTAAQFSAALRGWLAAPMAPEAATSRIAAVSTASAASGIPAGAHGSRHEHRSRWAIAALGLGALALVAVVALGAAPSATPLSNKPTDKPLAAAAQITASPSPSVEPSPLPVAPAVAPAGHATPAATPTPTARPTPPPPSPPPANHAPKHHAPKHHAPKHHHHPKHKHHPKHQR